MDESIDLVFRLAFRLVFRLRTPSHWLRGSTSVDGQAGFCCQESWPWCVSLVPLCMSRCVLHHLAQLTPKGDPSQILPFQPEHWEPAFLPDQPQ